MRKKIISFIFAVCLVIPCMFILTACGGSEPRCQHVWGVTRDPSLTATGATACEECGLDGFILPVLNDTDYTVEGSNPDYRKYTYTKDNKTYDIYWSSFELGDAMLGQGYRVIGYRGSSANIVIPDRMKGYRGEQPIHGIGNEVFKDETNITSVTLPSGLSRIGAGAFRGCTNLNSINLPETLTYIGDYAFADTNLTEVVIPNAVDDIGPLVATAHTPETDTADSYLYIYYREE